jgi:hypothetical protein
VRTGRELVTHYAAFVIELQSQRVQIVRVTPSPDEAFVLQAVRQLTDGVDGVVGPDQVLICNRDLKWSRAVVSFSRRRGCSGYPNAGAGTKLQRLCGAVCGPSKRSVWTVCWCWASGTYVVPSGSSSRTIRANGTTKASGMS